MNLRSKKILINHFWVINLIETSTNFLATLIIFQIWQLSSFNVLVREF